MKTLLVFILVAVVTFLGWREHAELRLAQARLAAAEENVERLEHELESARREITTLAAAQARPAPASPNSAPPVAATPTPKGAWMWQSRPGSLDRQPPPR